MKIGIITLSLVLSGLLVSADRAQAFWNDSGGYCDNPLILCQDEEEPKEQSEEDKKKEEAQKKKDAEQDERIRRLEAQIEHLERLLYMRTAQAQSLPTDDEEVTETWTALRDYLQTSSFLIHEVAAEDVKALRAQLEQRTAEEVLWQFKVGTDRLLRHVLIGASEQDPDNPDKFQFGSIFEEIRLDKTGKAYKRSWGFYSQVLVENSLHSIKINVVHEEEEEEPVQGFGFPK